MAKKIKPWPENYRDWSHFNYGPEGNPITQETGIQPPNSLRWLQTWRGRDMRIAQGMAIHPIGSDGKEGMGAMSARDAFNGLAYWVTPFESMKSGRKKQFDKVVKRQFTVTKHGIFYYPQGVNSQPFPNHVKIYAVRQDLKTGKILNTYSEGLTERDSVSFLKWGRGAYGNKIGKHILVVAGDQLIQSLHQELRVLDIETGALKWKYKAKWHITNLATNDAADTIFIQEADDASAGGSRWQESLNTKAITAVTKNGVAWRNTNTRLQHGISDLILNGKVVVAMNSATNMGGDKCGDDPKCMELGGKESRALGGVTTLSRYNGEILWKSLPYSTSLGKGANNMIVRPKEVVTNQSGFFAIWDVLTGYNEDNSRQASIVRDFNQRCTRMVGTPDWTVYGMISWINREKTSRIAQTVGRASCSYGPLLSHGNVYWTPNLACACFNGFRGNVSLTHDIIQEPIDDSKRLITHDSHSFKSISLANLLPEIQSSPIVKDWYSDSIFHVYRGGKTKPIEFNGMVIQGSIQEHLITAKRVGKYYGHF